MLVCRKGRIRRPCGRGLMSDNFTDVSYTKGYHGCHKRDVSKALPHNIHCLRIS